MKCKAGEGLDTNTVCWKTHIWGSF